MTTIGIPRALLYHKRHVLWSALLEGIGCRTVVSPPTNRRILERGTRLAVDESCLPMKVYLGHVDALLGRCDCVLVPRMESVVTHEHMCVKLMGAYDIVRNTLPDAPVVGYDVDVCNGVTERAQLLGLAAELGAGPLRARRALRDAAIAQRAWEVERAAEQEAMIGADSGRTRILLVGHAYNLADAMIGQPIVSLLGELEVDVLVSDHVDHELARRLSPAFSSTIKWTYNKELLGAIEMYSGKVDGVVFLVTFPCGPDSLMAELASRKLADTPVVTLVLDELAGETGLRTRLESFVDILKMRRAS